MVSLLPLLRASTGHARRRPLQSLLLIVGVALGVAVVVAIDLSNASALRAFQLSTEAVTGRATHRIVGGPDGLDDALYATLRTTRDPALAPAMRASAPVVEATVGVRELGERPLTLLGVDPFAEPPFRGFFGAGLQAGGALDTFLTRRGAVMLGEAVATRAGLEVGDPLTLRIGTSERTATLVGVLTPEDALARRALDGLVLADVSTAQELLGRTGRLDRIDLLLPEEPAARDRLLQRLAAVLPAEASVVPASEAQATVESMTEAFRLNLTALSLLALLVGAFLIFNTVRFSVVQRRATIGTLRALGVTRREIFGIVLGEAALLGLIGAVLGVGLGILLGRAAVGLVTRTINDLYFIVEVQGVAVEPMSLLRGAAAGLLAAIVAAVLPAWEATSVPPVTALRRSTSEESARGNVPRALAGAVLVGLLGLALLALPGGGVGLGLLALGAVVFAYALAAPAATVALMAAVRPVSSRVFGLIGRMAPRDVTRSLSRTAVAIAALMVAVCVSIGVSVMVGSFRITVERWLGDTLGADIYISPPSVTAARVEGSLEPALAEALAMLPEVTDYSTARGVQLREEALGNVDAVAILSDIGGDTRPYLDAVGTPAEVWQEVAGGAVIVSEPFFRRHDRGVGDSLRLRTDEGPRTFDIAGVFYDYGSERGTIYISDEVYRRYWDDERITSIALSLRPNVDADAFALQLSEELGAGRWAAAPELLEVRSNRGLRQEVLEVFDRAFAITTALQVLAILVAFIGVLSALLALQLERAREQATLRSTGMTRRQLGGLSLLQTGLMGGVAGLLSWPAGLTLALILIYVINRRSFGWTIQTHLEAEVFLRALLLAISAALLAGLYPTWRLGRMPIANALREE